MRSNMLLHDFDMLNIFIIMAVLAMLAIPAGVANAELIVLASATGTADPITYTTLDGTFTTGPINFSLNNASTSFFNINDITGEIQSHTVFNVSFNDGRGANLTGVLTLDESGVLGPQPILLNIDSGTLAG